MNSRLVLNKSFLGGMVLSVTSTPTAVATLPCDNLLNGMRHKICRIVPSNNTAAITVTMTDSTLLSAIGIGGFNLSSSATADCIVKNSSNTTVYDSETENVYTNSSQYDLPWFGRTKFWFPDAPVSAKTIEIVLNDTTNPMEISHIVFGVDISPSICPDWGVNWNWADTSIQQRTAGGSLLMNPSYGHRKMQMTWSLLPDSDYGNLSTFLQSQGQSLMISLMATEASRRKADMQMIGRLVSADGINLVGYNVNSMASVIIEEI